MKFDPTINLGTLLAAGAILIGLFTAHLQNVRRIERMETKVSVIFEWFQKIVINGYRPTKDHADES